ncbi:uncharacterized protein LOC112602807 [Melanaphis sacchari]|uniref:uncharacterized protein LOC112602807 n=1 Tax=Melanaphis sacchari TaxID=742174 RepID=UPI000DC14CBA|nr:uncharacterized protein LOC112602807 [Melanaphis sacchari]
MESKRKGGAEKMREKKKKLLIKSSESCLKINQCFSSNTHSDSVMKKNLCNQPQISIQNSNVSNDEVNFGASTSSTSSNLMDFEDNQLVQNQDVIVVKDINVDIYEKSQISYFKKPNKNYLGQFFEYHPQQPFLDIPFKSTKAFYRKNKTQRGWLSYDIFSQSLFCSVCLCFFFRR